MSYLLNHQRVLGTYGCGSHENSIVKHARVVAIPGWVTPWEVLVLQPPLFSKLFSSDLCLALLSLCSGAVSRATLAVTILVETRPRRALRLVPTLPSFFPRFASVFRRHLSLFAGGVICSGAQTEDARRVLVFGI